MIKKSVILTIKLLAGTVVFAGLITCGSVLFYLKGIPYLVSNDRVINYIEDIGNKSLGADIIIEKPVVKTDMSPNIFLGVKTLKVTNKKVSLLDIENTQVSLSLAEILNKKIILKSAKADYVFADINRILDLPVFKTKKESKKSDWNFDIYQSVLAVKDSKILYNIDKNTNIIFSGKDLRIDEDIKKKHVNYNIDVIISKGKNNLNIKTSDENCVYLLNKEKFVIENTNLYVNKFKILLAGTIDAKSNYDIKLSSKNFSVPYVIDFLNSQIIENNLQTQLAYFNDIKGNFDFDIKVKNNNLNGKINLNNLSFKLVPFMNMPVLLNNGKVSFDNNKIDLKNFKGYYGGKIYNKMDFDGTIKDYLKSVDTNLVGNAIVTDDFSSNYLSKMIGYPVKIKGKADTRVMLKSKNNKIDLVWLYMFKKGTGFVIDGEESTMNNLANRVAVAKMHFEDMVLDIKSIDYYAGNPDDNRPDKRIPILSMRGAIDFSNGQTFVRRFGMELPKPMPSGFINMLAKQKLFKGGTFTGYFDVLNRKGYPVKVKADMKVSDLRIPSQRLYIKSGEFKTDKDHMHIAANGKYRRSSYDLNGTILNEIKFPIIVKDINLNLDTVDVEKYLQAFNAQQPTEAAADVNAEIAKSVSKAEIEDDDDNTQTFDLANLIVENCVLKVNKGFYKDINFSNVVANLTLDKQSVLKINSNKFDIAEGQSTSKITCDLRNHKYSLWLALIKVNSNIIATSLLNLPKEINGKASGLMELETDDSLKLNGRIQFRVYEGIIPKIGLVEYTMKVAALFRNPFTMVSPTVVNDLVSVPEGKFDQIDGDLKLKDNVIKPMMIKSSSPQLSSFIIGTYNLENQDAALRIYTKFSNSKKGVYGFLRNISLNSLANRIPLGSRNDSDYYSAEISQLPKIDAEEKDCQIFLTKVDGDIVQNNFLSSLKKIK